jgi:hypothetical protein
MQKNISFKNYLQFKILLIEIFFIKILILSKLKEFLNSHINNIF